MKTILITGGAGKVGYKLAEELLKRECVVISIDNLSPPFTASKQERVNLLKNYKNFFFYNVDLITYQDVEPIFKQHKPDTVVHLAGRLRNTFLMIKDNLLTTAILLEIMAKTQNKILFYDDSLMDKNDPNYGIYKIIQDARNVLIDGYSQYYQIIYHPLYPADYDTLSFVNDLTN